MKLTAIDADTGRVLLSQAGSLSEENFRKTVIHSFPEIEEDKIVVIIDGRIQNRTGTGSKKRRNVSYKSNSKSVLWKGSFCLHPTTKVLTGEGTKEIKDVTPGDIVLTHKGRFRKVLRRSSRPWNGNMLSIRTALDKEEMLITPNHRIASIKYPSSECALKDVRAEKLSLHDFLFVPIPNHYQFDPFWMSQREEYYVTKTGTFSKIKSIIEIPYEGLVYDLEVEEDHSYTANGKAVHNSDLGGYANLNREICMRLPQHGFQVKIEMLRTAPQVDPMTANILRAMENARIDNETRCPLVVGFTPMPVRAIGRKVIFYTMMETQGLHPEFAKRCNTSAREIWVPCGFYADVFKRSGIIRPIEVLPLGVNHRIYTPEAKEPHLIYEEMPSGKPTEVLPEGKRFISVFGWSARKGPDILCRSFMEEFDGDDDAYLVIYSRYMGSSAEQHKEYVRNEIRGHYSGIPKAKPARIFYCGDCVPINDLPGCYAAADAFVFCSRGEGFSLTNIEAASCGVPVISSLNTGMTEYLDETVAYCVEPEGYSTSNDLCWISGYYRDQQFAVMGDASVNKFRRAMRSFLDDPKEAEQKSQNFRDRVLTKYTWDLCAERVANKLTE